MLYLVDWDLPAKPSRYRVRFHRHLKGLIKKLNGHTIKYSSMSVVVTESQDLAEGIHALAKSCSARRTSIYSLNGGMQLLRKHRGRKPATVTPATS